MLLAPNAPALGSRSWPCSADAGRALEDAYRAVAAALARELKARYDRLGIAPDLDTIDLPAAVIGPDPVDRAWVVRLIDLAGGASAAAPTAVVGRVSDALNFIGKPVNGSRVLVVGLGPDQAGLAVLERLLAKGARVEYHDPAFPTLPDLPQYPRLRLVSRDLSVGVLAACDAVVVLAAGPGEADLVRKHAGIVIDARA